jgi:hypothetical protein
MTPEQAFRELVRRHTPPALGWSLASVPVVVTSDELSVRDALPTQMHFASITLERASGRMTWADEDHRDGGDFVEHSVTISDEELRSLGLR